MTSPTFFPAADPSNYNNNKQPEVVNQFIDFTSELLKSLQAESCLSKVSNNDGIDQNQLIVNSSTMLECFPLSSSPLTTMPLPQQSTQTDPLFNTNNSIMHISSSTPRPKRDYSDLFYLQGFLSSSSSSPVSSTSPSKLIQEVELPLSNKRQRPLGPSDSSTTCPSVSRCSTKPAPYYSSPSATSAPKQSAAKIQNFNHRSSPETKQQQLQIAPRPDPNSVSKQKSPSPSHSPNQPAVHITTDSAIECGADLVTSISSGKRLRAIQLISHIIMYKVEISYESAQLAIMEAVKKNQYDILASLLSEFKMHVTFKLLEEAAQIPIIFEHKSTRAHTAATRTRRCLHIYFGKKGEFRNTHLIMSYLTHTLYQLTFLERDVKLLHHFASKQVQNISELILLLIDDTRLFSDYDLEAALQQSIHDHTVSVFETFIHYKRSRLRDARLLDWCLLQIVFALKHSPSIQAAFLQSMFPYRLDVNFLPKITALRAAVASKFDPTSFRIHDLITDAELATASQEDRKWMIDEALRLNFIHGILRMDLSPEENLYARRNAWRLGMATLCAALESKSSHKPRSKLLVSSPPSFST